MKVCISSPGTLESLYRKMDNLGMTVKNYKTRLIELSCVRIPNTEKDVAQDWCEEHCGDNWIWSSPTQTDYTDIVFASEDDALVFKLTFATA